MALAIGVSATEYLESTGTQAIEHELRELKSCGFNGLRKHIKIESRVYYALADRLGVMIFQDMPSDSPLNHRSHAPDDGANTDTVRYGFYRRDLKRVIDSSVQCAVSGYDECSRE